MTTGRCVEICLHHGCSNLYRQINCERYPTVARIALDVIPAQGSAVPCEHLFSGSKQTATDLRASLGPERFEELQILKSDWRETVFDYAQANDAAGEEEWDNENAAEYEAMLKADEELSELDRLLLAATLPAASSPV